MKKRIAFQSEKILKDGSYSETYGIYGLNCFEYTFWQLLRQAGVKSCHAAIHTKAFVTENRPLYKLLSIRTIADNLGQLEKNAKNFYGLKQISYSDMDQKIALHSFIREHIDKENFVYILYNNYFNTINNKTFRPHLREYHATLLTGYDDERREYIPLNDGIYNVGYEDLSRMISNFKQEGDWIYRWSVFALEKHEEVLHLPLSLYRKNIADDLMQTMADWKTESMIFEKGAEQLKDDFPHMGKELNSREIKKLEKMAMLFRNSRLGFHGNLYLKLMALREAGGSDAKDLYEEFYAGTAGFKKISNVLIRLTIDYDYGKLCQAADEIHRIFVTEAGSIRKKIGELIIENGKEQK